MIAVSAFTSFTLAVILLISGKILTLRMEILRRYSIPEPVVGGLICAAAVALVYAFWGRMIVFDLEVRDFLLLAFFASIGLKSDVRMLLSGGKPLAILLILSTVFLILQNLVGMGLAGAFGLQPVAGLLVGSISLTGGLGTTTAWAPIFVERFGIDNAMELGVASNTVGLISACVIGGPVAAWLIKRHGVEVSRDRRLDIGAPHVGAAPRLDYFGVLWAILAVNVAVMIGTALAAAVAKTGFTLPAFVCCLIAGILIRNLPQAILRRPIRRIWPGADQGLALLSDLALGLFLTMALMGMQIWLLSGVLGFIAVVLTIQILLTVAFAVWAVFPAMGRDYEAVVMSSAFGGITLGSTATAIASMTAVTQQYGAAHRAFILIPLVSGFFIDLINALVIGAFVG